MKSLFILSFSLLSVFCFGQIKKSKKQMSYRDSVVRFYPIIIDKYVPANNTGILNNETLKTILCIKKRHKTSIFRHTTRDEGWLANDNMHRLTNGKFEDNCPCFKTFN